MHAALAQNPATSLKTLALLLAYPAVILAGAAFGIFYAWISTTMWGLDAAPPEVAVRAMQEMNAAIRNGVFFVVFFLTSVALLAVAALALVSGSTGAAWTFAAAGAVSLFGCVVFTGTVLVPMNAAFGLLTPETPAAAAAAWAEYSPTWQQLNILRTGFCGTAFLLGLIGLRLL